MDYVYIHHIVGILNDRVDDVFNLFPLLLLVIIPVLLFISFKKSKHKDDEKEARSESVISPKVDKLLSHVLISFMIICGVAVLALIVAREFLAHHDRKVKIENTKTWTRVIATVLDARTEVKYIGGKHSEYDHCYHIRVEYDVNQIHYTSEIEFLEPCEPNLLVGVDYSNAARYYYPPNATTLILVDPKNPQHVRDVNYIKPN